MSVDVDRLFRVTHLQDPHLQQFSAHFRDLSLFIDQELPPSAEKTLALRALWDAKNLGVYAKGEAQEAAAKTIALSDGDLFKDPK